MDDFAHLTKTENSLGDILLVVDAAKYLGSSNADAAYGYFQAAGTFRCVVPHRPSNSPKTECTNCNGDPIALFCQMTNGAFFMQGLAPNFKSRVHIVTSNPKILPGFFLAAGRGKNTVFFRRGEKNQWVLLSILVTDSPSIIRSPAKS